MFGKHNTLTRLSSGIAIAASLAVIAVPSALATTSSRSFSTDTLGGNGSPKAAPDAIGRYVGSHATPQGKAFAWDTLGANGQPVRPAVFYSHRQSTPAPPTREAAVSSAGGSGFSWGDAGIGAGLAAGVLLLLLAGTRLRTNRRGAIIA